MVRTDLPPDPAPKPSPHSGLARSVSLSEALAMHVTLVEQDDSRLGVSLDAAFSLDSVPYTKPKRWWWGTDQYHVQYGLNGGELHLELTNAEAPMRDRYHHQIPESFTETLGLSREVGFERTLKGSLSLEMIGLESEAKTSETLGREWSGECQRFTVSAAGQPARPFWRFTMGPMGYLSGNAPGENPPLAKLTVRDGPVGMRAVFVIWPSNLHIVHVHADSLAKATPLMKKHLAVVKSALPSMLRRFIPVDKKGRLILAYALDSFPRSIDVPTTEVTGG